MSFPEHRSSHTHHFDLYTKRVGVVLHVHLPFDSVYCCGGLPVTTTVVVVMFISVQSGHRETPVERAPDTAQHDREVCGMCNMERDKLTPPNRPYVTALQNCC